MGCFWKLKKQNKILSGGHRKMKLASYALLWSDRKIEVGGKSMDLYPYLMHRCKEKSCSHLQTWVPKTEVSGPACDPPSLGWCPKTRPTMPSFSWPRVSIPLLMLHQNSCNCSVSHTSEMIQLKTTFFICFINCQFKNTVPGTGKRARLPFLIGALSWNNSQPLEARLQSHLCGRWREWWLPSTAFWGSFSLHR